MAESLTNKQVKFKLQKLTGATTSFTTPSTSANGDIVFVYNEQTLDKTDAVRKIFARGVEFDGTNTHYVSPLTITAGGTEVVKFTQDSAKTIDFAGSGAISVSKTANKSEITIAHQSGAGYEHIPGGNTTANRLLVGTSTSGTAQWLTGTIGSATVPVYVNASGVITTTGKTLAQSVTTSSKLTDTTYKMFTNSATSGTAAGTSTSNPYLILRSAPAGTVPSGQTLASAANDYVRFSGANGIKVSASTANQITIGVDTANYAIPTTDEVTNWNAAYTWYNTVVAPTTADADTVINKWNDVVSFLSDMKDTSTLSGMLDGKAAKGHVHSVVTITANGFAPKIVNGGSVATTETDTLYLVNSGSTAVWKKLPSSAYATPDASLGRIVYGKYTTTAYSPTQKAGTSWTSSADSSVHLTLAASESNNTATITVSGPSLIAANGTKGTTSSYNASVQAQTLFWTDIS